MIYYRVYYRHLKGYYVFQAYTDPAKAEEFISVNAMVYPLPGMYRTIADCSTFPPTETEVESFQ